MIVDVAHTLVLHVVGVLRGLLPLFGGMAAAFTLLGFVAAPCNPGLPGWRKPDLLTDAVCSGMLPLVTSYVRIAFLIVGAALVYGLSTPDELGRFFAGGVGPLAGLPIWGQAIAYLLGADLLMYGTHRAFHTMTLWRYHAVHHAPEHLDWTSANRFHPVNVIFHSVLADSVLLLAGIAPETLALLAPFNVGMSALVHANLDWTFGPFRFVLASPVFHRWHHTDYRRGGNRNFAPTFPVIDLAFGTFYMPPGELPDRFGVHDKHFPHEILGQLLYPFRKRRKAGKAAGTAVPAA